MKKIKYFYKNLLGFSVSDIDLSKSWKQTFIVSISWSDTLFDVIILDRREFKYNVICILEDIKDILELQENNKEVIYNQIREFLKKNKFNSWDTIIIVDTIFSLEDHAEFNEDIKVNLKMTEQYDLDNVQLIIPIWYPWSGKSTEAWLLTYKNNKNVSIDTENNSRYRYNKRVNSTYSFDSENFTESRILWWLPNSVQLKSFDLELLDKYFKVLLNELFDKGSYEFRQFWHIENLYLDGFFLNTEKKLDTLIKVARENWFKNIKLYYFTPNIERCRKNLTYRQNKLIIENTLNESMISLEDVKKREENWVIVIEKEVQDIDLIELEFTSHFCTPYNRQWWKWYSFSYIKSYDEKEEEVDFSDYLVFSNSSLSWFHKFLKTEETEYGVKYCNYYFTEERDTEWVHPYLEENEEAYRLEITYDKLFDLYKEYKAKYLNY